MFVVELLRLKLRTGKTWLGCLFNFYPLQWPKDSKLSRLKRHELSRSTRLQFFRRQRAPRSYHSPVTPLHNTKLYRGKGNYREVTDHSFPWGNFRHRRAAVSRDYYTPWSALWSSFERYYRRLSMAQRR